MFLTAMLGAAVLFPPQDAAPDQDPARALYERVTQRFAKAPALHMDATMKLSMVLPGMEEEQDLGTFHLSGQLAKPLYGSLSIEGKISFMGQDQEMEMEMVANGESIFQVDHAEQTAMSTGDSWSNVFEPPFGFDLTMAWAGLELPGFDEIAFAEADEAHAGLTGLVLETESSRRVIWLDAEENLVEYSTESSDPAAMEPSITLSFASVELLEKVDPTSYKRTVPEGYEVSSLAAELEGLGYAGDEEVIEEVIEEPEDADVPPYEKDLLAVGAEAPDVVFTSMEDATYKLSSLRGKTVLLNFWFYH